MEAIAGDYSLIRKKLQNAALVLPHVGLVIMTSLYVAIGAFVFYMVESREEEHVKNSEIAEIRSLQSDYMQEMMGLATRLDEGAWKEVARAKLLNLSARTMAAFEMSLTAREIVRNESEVRWTFTSAVFFSSIVMTTVGYGNTVPRSPWGKLFCLVYALFGIPLMLVTIADLSKFFAMFIAKTTKKVQRSIRTFTSKHSIFRKASAHQMRISQKLSRSSRSSRKESEEQSDKLDIRAPAQPVPPAAVLAMLGAYTALGAFAYHKAEGWGLGAAYYFCFITMTTIGFGDLVPNDSHLFYMLLNLGYILLGLVLTTMSVDIVGSHYIREMHYVGRKITSMKQLMSLLGGKAASAADIVANMKVLQRQYGITDAQIAELMERPEFRDFISKPKEPEQYNGMGGPFTPWNIDRMRYIDISRHSVRSSMITDVDGSFSSGSHGHVWNTTREMAEFDRERQSCHTNAVMA